jgi:hypothetical protein
MIKFETAMRRGLPIQGYHLFNSIIIFRIQYIVMKHPVRSECRNPLQAGEFPTPFRRRAEKCLLNVDPIASNKQSLVHSETILACHV